MRIHKHPFAANVVVVEVNVDRLVGVVVALVGVLGAAVTPHLDASYTEHIVVGIASLLALVLGLVIAASAGGE